MVMQLTQHDIAGLKAKGFKEEEISQAVKELEQEQFMGAYNKTTSPNAIGGNQSAFQTKVSDDVAKQQLELNDILEKAEHILNGDVVVFEKGQTIWKNNPHPEKNTLNKFGVNVCMKFLSMYVNRNTILADYTDEEVRYKALDFGKRFNNLIFQKYEEMGMDCEEKRKEYSMLVGAMTDIIHSTYSRAKEGRERESYRKMISVSATGQSQQGSGININAQPQQRTRGLLNPMRYVSGKYV